MVENNDDKKKQNASFDDWQSWMEGYVSPYLTQFNQYFDLAGDPEQTVFKGRVGESLRTNLKMWQAVMAGASVSDSFERLQKVTEVTPDIALGFSQSCLESINNLQSHATEWLQKRGEALSQADIQELDRDLLRQWNDIYKQEFSKYLNIPQIGLSRLYQERGLKAVDKMNAFQLELSSFLHMLYMPIEKSLQSLQEEMAAMAESGTLDDDSKAYYNMWIKSMEGHYMELFKAPEYSEAMHRTLSSLNDFSEAKNEVTNDFLKQMNMPTLEDIDDLSKEIYLLKKRIRALEKK